MCIRDRVRTLALGADATNCARGMMFALGCIQALKCNTNKCPTGIATQDAALSSSLHVPTKEVRVANFHRATVHAAREIIGAEKIVDFTPKDYSLEALLRRAGASLLGRVVGPGGLTM